MAPASAPAWAFVACLAVGVIAPAATYAGSRLRVVEWLWTVPAVPLSTILWAIAVSAIASLLLLAVARGAERWGFAASEGLPIAARWGKAIGFVAVVASVGYLSFRWKYRGFPLDWYAWLQFANDPFIMGSEPLGRWSHYLSYEAISTLGLDRWIGRTESRAMTALRLSSVAAGVFYAAALLVLAPRAFPRSERWASFLFLWVTPTAILFAGYMEVTPWRYAFTGAYLLTGLRYLTLDLRRPPWIESLALMLAIWSHGSACFVAGAHAYLCLRWFFGPRRGAVAPWQPLRLGQLALVCLLPFLALGATMLVAYYFGSGHRRFAWYGNALGGPDHIFTIAWSAAQKQKPTHYVFGSARYLIDQLNLLLFACPLLPLLVPALAWSRRPRPAQALFLLLGFAGLLLFALVFNPADRGGVQADFDLMAGYAVPATMIVWLWWDARFGNRQREALALAVAAATFVFLLAPVLHFP